MHAADQSWIKELERSVASGAVGSGLRSQVHRKKSRQRNITIGYKIGCTGDYFTMKISATTSMKLFPTHKHKNVSDEFFSTLYLLVCS